MFRFLFSSKVLVIMAVIRKNAVTARIAIRVDPDQTAYEEAV